MAARSKSTVAQTTKSIVAVVGEYKGTQTLSVYAAFKKETP